MMMVLGLYVFMLRTVPYQELQYQRSWRHAANSRVNRRPSTQFLGPDNDSLTLSGVLLPEVTAADCHYWRWNKWLNWARHGL